MGQEMSHSIADDNGEDHAPKKRKRGDDTPPTAASPASSASALATVADADATKLRQMMDQNLSQMKRMEKIMDHMETRLSRVDHLEDQCKELEERCKHLERSNHPNPNNGTSSNNNETAATSSAVSSTKKRGRGRPPKKKSTAQDVASVEKEKSPPPPISNTNTTKAASTPKSATLKEAATTLPQSKISANNTATAGEERKLHTSKKRRSRDGDTDSTSPLFALNETPPSSTNTTPNNNSSVRPKRKLKQITKFDPSNQKSNNKKSPATGSGFACPKCSHICSYYDTSRVCNKCGLECYYEAGVGVVVLKERDSGTTSPQRLKVQKKKSGDANTGKKTAGATENVVVESVQVAIISETAKETVLDEGEKGAMRKVPATLSKATNSNDNYTTTAINKTEKNGTTATTTKKPGKGRTAKTTAIIASSSGDKTTKSESATTTLESPIPKRKRGRPRKSMEVGRVIDGSRISQTIKQKSKEGKVLVKVAPHRTRSKSLNR